MQTVLALIGRLFQLAIALVLIAIGVVFFISLMLVGLAVSAVWAIWCLLRGRRPVFFRFGSVPPGMDPRQAWARFHAGPFGRPPRPSSGAGASTGSGTGADKRTQAIDVEVRDVPSDPPPRP